MGDRYWLKMKCGACKEYNPSTEDYEKDPMGTGVYYAPSSGFMDFNCRKCGKINWIETAYMGRVVTEEELNELYKEEGFE